MAQKYRARRAKSSSFSILIWRILPVMGQSGDELRTRAEEESNIS